MSKSIILWLSKEKGKVVSLLLRAAGQNIYFVKSDLFEIALQAYFTEIVLRVGEQEAYKEE